MVFQITIPRFKEGKWIFRIVTVENAYLKVLQCELIKHDDLGILYNGACHMETT